MHTGVMRVKGDDIAYAHVLQLLKRQGAIQAFAAGAAVLPPLVEHGHDDADAFGPTADGGDDALEVLIMIVRRHGHRTAIHLIFHVIRADIAQDIDIVAAHAAFDHALSLAGAKARAMCLDQKILPVIAHQREQRRVLQRVLLLVPLHQPAVYLLSEFLAARHRNQPQGTEGHGQQVVVPGAYKVRHKHAPFYVTGSCGEQC